MKSKKTETEAVAYFKFLYSDATIIVTADHTPYAEVLELDKNIIIFNLN